MNLDVNATYLQFGNPSERFSVSLSVKQLLSVKKLSVHFENVSICFIYANDGKPVFLYEDSVHYSALLNLLRKPNKNIGVVLLKYADCTDPEHELWKQLVKAASGSYYEYLRMCGGHRLAGAYHDMPFSVPQKIDSIDSVYDFLVSVLPENIEETKRRKALRDKAAFEAELKQMEEAAKAKRQQNEQKAKSLQITLERQYGPVSYFKKNLRSSIDQLNFSELQELAKEYDSQTHKWFERMNQADSAEEAAPYKPYIDVYRLGSVLISDQMNHLNRNKTKNKYIPQDLLDEAMVFYYDSDSPQSARAARSAEVYAQAKESGDKGEKKVDYALKWLDKSYMKIEKRSKDKAGSPCIILSNPSFIDEKQEYDHLIVSSKGVFNIETKNFAGKLVVDKAGNWIRKKNGEEKGVKNPLQQVRQHEKLLASFLPKECHIISILCIANDKAIIEGSEHCPIPIVKSDLLVELIENWQTTDSKLSAVQKKHCITAIYEHMV